MVEREKTPKHWLRRILIGLGVTGAALIAFVMVWVFANSRDLPPPDVSDLRMDRIAVQEEENAFPLIQSALESMQWDDSDQWVRDFLDGEGTDEGAIAALVEANAESISLMSRAAERHQCVMPGPPPNIFTEGKLHENWTKFPRLMQLSIRLETAAGHHHEAVSRCLVLHQTGLLIQQYPESLLYYLIGYRYKHVAISEMSRLARSPGVAEADLRRMRQAILDAKQPVADSLKIAIKGEYGAFEHMVGHLARAMDKTKDEGALDSRFDAGVMKKIMTRAYLYQPNRTLSEGADFFRLTLRHLDGPYHEIQQKDKDYFADRGYYIDEDPGVFKLLMTPNMIGNSLLFMGLPVLETPSRHKCRDDFDAASMVVIVALELHRRAHGGYPESLEDLVGSGLEAVPTDPYDGKPIRYSAEKGLIHSVGPDGVDSVSSSDDEDDWEDDLVMRFR